MKKRSLLTAVVMLVVSAILLTSSTYAWFAGRHEATVAKTIATVSGSDLGNVQVSWAEDSGWTTALTAGTTKALTPVDIEPFTIGMETIQNVDFDGTNYTVGTGSTNDMQVYTWYVRAVNRGSNSSIVIPVAFTGGNALYAVIYVDDVIVKTTAGGTTPRVWGTGGDDSYVSLGQCTAAVENGENASATTNKGIIDSTNDTVTGTLGDSVTANTGASTTISIDISSEATSGYGTAHAVKVMLWAEGQDSNCVGGIDVNNGGFSFGAANTGNQTGNGIHLAA